MADTPFDEPVDRQLLLSIVRFLQRLLEKCTPEDRESLEVGIQCIETAFDLNLEEGDTLSRIDLETVFRSAQEQSEHNLERAEELKNLGNQHMRNHQYSLAVEMYDGAIKLNSKNAVYYCNRAAAHSQVGNHQNAVDDCKEAVKLDPTYSKAYGRLGVAYCHLHKFKEAREAYIVAKELDPNNTNYETNLKLTEQQMMTEPSAGAPDVNISGIDFNQIIRNPAFLSLASQMLNDPNLRNVVGGLSNTPNVQSIIQMGQELAEQMQASNPTMIENLRRQFERAGPEGHASDEAGPSTHPDPEDDDQTPPTS